MLNSATLTAILVNKMCIRDRDKDVPQRIMLRITVMSVIFMEHIIDIQF